MRTIAICLIALVSVASGLSMMEKYPGAFNFSKKRSIMAVMTQVEATMKAKGPLDAVTRILAEYQAEIRAEQIAHDQLHEKQVAECKSEISFRKEEIADGQSALQIAQETLAACQATLARATADLALNLKHQKEKTAELIATHTHRNAAKYKYDTTVGYLTQAIGYVEEALTYLDAIFSGEPAFLQLSKHANQLLKNSVTIRQAHHMAPILAALAELGDAELQADSALLEKLQNLFNEYKQKMADGLVAANAAEAEAIKVYNATVARLEATLAALKEAEINLKAEIETAKKCIIEQTNRINQATAKIARNQRLLAAAVKMCDAAEKQYVAAKEGRLAELDLLAAITIKVNEHYANLAAGVVERGKLDNFDDTYTNASDYDHQEFTPAL